MTKEEALKKIEELNKFIKGKEDVFHFEVGEEIYYIDASNRLYHTTYEHTFKEWADQGNVFKASEEKFARKLLKKRIILNKLQIIAHRLNDGWSPDFSKDTINSMVTVFCGKTVCISSSSFSYHDIGLAYFKTKDLAQKAIDIIGEKEIIEAFSV